jgi:hypothetical protein
MKITVDTIYGEITFETQEAEDSERAVKMWILGELAVNRDQDADNEETAFETELRADLWGRPRMTLETVIERCASDAGWISGPDGDANLMLVSREN